MSSIKKKAPHDISKGVSYDDFKSDVQETFDKIVKPQLKAEEHLTAEQKKIVLTSKDKAYANCQSPY